MGAFTWGAAGAAVAAGTAVDAGAEVAAGTAVAAGAEVLAGICAVVGVACGAQDATTAPAADKALSCNIFRREIFLISILLNYFLKIVWVSQAL